MGDRRTEERGGILGDGLLLLLGLLDSLALVELGRHLDKDLWVLGEESRMICSTRACSGEIGAVELVWAFPEGVA